MENNQTPQETCQACGRAITGVIHRFTGDPSSAFCSLDCQISRTRPVVVEVELKPISAPAQPRPAYRGPTASVLHYDRGCECDVLYENQITVPKRHSIICFCPRCGCVTQD